MGTMLMNLYIPVQWLLEEWRRGKWGKIHCWFLTKKKKNPINTSSLLMHFVCFKTYEEGMWKDNHVKDIWEAWSWLWETSQRAFPGAFARAVLHSSNLFLAILTLHMFHFVPQVPLVHSSFHQPPSANTSCLFCPSLHSVYFLQIIYHNTTFTCTHLFSLSVFSLTPFFTVLIIKIRSDAILCITVRQEAYTECTLDYHFWT